MRCAFRACPIYTVQITHVYGFKILLYITIDVYHDSAITIDACAIVIVTDELKMGREDAGIDKDGRELTPHAVISTITSL